jgi:hypothetical protein
LLSARAERILQASEAAQPEAPPGEGRLSAEPDLCSKLKRSASSHPSRPILSGQLSFGVTLRSKPTHLELAVHPIIRIGFTGKTTDDPDVRTANAGFDQPISLGDPLCLK